MLNNLTLNFNLRSPRKTKSATPIYCVIAIDGRQSKVPMGLKVNAYQWNKQRQLCTIAANMTESDRNNNIAANAKLNAVRCAYDEYFSYLCANSIEGLKANEIEREIRDRINSIVQLDMANKNAIPPKRTITATTLIKRAFEIRYPKDGTKAGTLETQNYRLNPFFEYVKQSKKGDTPQNHLTQEGLNDYKEYLQGGPIKRSAIVINQCCQLIERLINTILCVNSEFRKYKLSLVKYVKIADKRKQSDSKKIALTDEEIAAVKSVTELNEMETEYRDIFLMQIETGVRVSDLPKLFSRDYKITHKDGETIYTINTEKEGITAAIILTPTIAEIQNKYKGGFAFNDFSKSNNKTYYNNALKTICRKAKLTRKVEYIDAHGNKKIEPIYNIITNHDARHTFVTQKLRQGYTPAEISKMTGHADTRMIEKVYQHLTEEDKALQVVKAKKRNDKKAAIESEITVSNDSEIIAEQARENHKQRKTIAKQRQMIAIEQQRQEIAELFKNVENESVKELLQLVQMHLENGDIKQAQEIIKDLQKYGAGVQLLSDEEAAEFESYFKSENEY